MSTELLESPSHLWTRVRALFCLCRCRIKSIEQQHPHCPQQYPQHPAIGSKRLWAMRFSICPYFGSLLHVPREETQGFEVLFPSDTNFSFSVLYCKIERWPQTKASSSYLRILALVHTFSPVIVKKKKDTKLFKILCKALQMLTKLQDLICIFGAMMFKLHCNLARVGKGYRWVNSGWVCVRE